MEKKSEEVAGFLLCILFFCFLICLLEVASIKVAATFLELAIYLFVNHNFNVEVLPLETMWLNVFFRIHLEAMLCKVLFFFFFQQLDIPSCFTSELQTRNLQLL